ncbi:MFS transporter, partial [Lactobacillus delbrueckii subsp. bulgaricus]|nr:MFS transporter [Lactobacillus delbrueckii subsp. bulgaricus]
WRGGFVREAMLIGLILVPLAISIKPEPTTQYPAYGKAMRSSKKVALTGLGLKQALKMPVFYAVAFAMLALQFV